jgi:hypothetical protein
MQSTQASTMMSLLRSSLLLCVLCFLAEIPSGSSLSPGDIAKLSRREALKRLPVAVASISIGSLLSAPSQAHAAAFQDDLRSSLKPASDEQPRIPLPTSQDAQSETTVVEGKFTCLCCTWLFIATPANGHNHYNKYLLRRYCSKILTHNNNQNMQAY